MATNRVNLMIAEDLRDDLHIIASITGDSAGQTLDKAVIYYINGQDEKVKKAVEAARKARQ